MQLLAVPSPLDDMLCGFLLAAAVGRLDQGSTAQHRQCIAAWLAAGSLL
jgi:hypothetical protein